MLAASPAGSWTAADVAIIVAVSAVLLGAVVALSYAVYAYVERTQRGMTDLKVSVAVLSPNSAAGGPASDPVVVVTAANAGLLPVVITAASLELVSGETMPYLGYPLLSGAAVLPKRLKPGEDALMPMGDVRQMAKAIAARHTAARSAHVTIASGRTFDSEPIGQGWLETWAPKDDDQG
jgi:hypothetical protein